MPEEIELFAEGGSVRAERGGSRVSGLTINMRRLQIAPGVLVECGGIGGVGTPPEHRGRGYSTKVMAEAMAHMKRLGKHVSGLYTGPRIVAHRLYRRFGFADVTPLRERVKYLDFAAFVRSLATRRMARLLESEAGAGAARGDDLMVELHVAGAGAATVHFCRGSAGVSSGADPAASVAVSMGEEAFTSLAGGTMGWTEAEGLGLVEVVRGGAGEAARAARMLFGSFRSPLEAL